MILLTGFYHDPDPHRRGELLECIKRNLANDSIDEVRVFIEDATAPETISDAVGQHKLTLIQLGRRMTFRFLFDYANENLNGQTVLVVNADIYFDETLGRLNGYDLDGKLLCLSRWDVQADGSLNFFEHSHSQDAWIFKAPIAPIDCDFYLGKPACDNRLAWEAEHAGLQVINPSRSIRACHLHVTQVRRYTESERLPGRVKGITATWLETPYPSERGTPPGLDCAVVAFSDRIGYTIAELAPGVSSHNNDTRPIQNVPQQLRGLQFTQQVSYKNSAFEIEFLSAGKLYVLVGNDWSGHEVAVDWLRRVGFREPIPFVKTTEDFGFEVWSLAGEKGECHVLPSQVILATRELVKRDAHEFKVRVERRRSKNESIYALTSLPPRPRDPAGTSECINSWRAAGLKVVAFNHPSEIETLSQMFDVEFVPVEKTASETFGGHYVFVNTLLDWAAEQNALVLLINADIRLQLEAWELQRIRRLCDGGLGYFIRFNHDGDIQRAGREVHGIDAFLLHGRDASLFRKSFLSLGQPWWDYWVPLVFANNNRPVRGIDFPVAFHRNHQQNWSWENWTRCGVEFGRAVGFNGNGGFEPSGSTAWNTRCKIQQHTTSLSQQPINIRRWAEEKFSGPGSKVFLELGAHNGADTAWLAQISGVMVHVFEPDLRNQPQARPNVIVHQKAIGAHDGHASMVLSQCNNGEPWSHSSSIKQPFNCLLRHPLTFGQSIPVALQTLDSFCDEQSLGVIDFIWADIEGAEGDMIRGGRESLKRTRYLFTEFSDDELFEDQVTLGEILEMLPQFKVIEVWHDYVLLENQELLDYRKAEGVSQLGQDKLVDKYLHGKRNGVFVEIGAYDGVTISNTLMLEKERGWTGICIEPLPDAFAALRRNRSCICVQTCIGDRDESEVEFLAVQSEFIWTRMLSGVLSEYDSRHLARVDLEIDQFGGSKSVIRLPMRRLDTVLQEHGISKVDFLSIDTEGSELSIIGSTNFASIGNPCIAVENNYDDPAIDLALKEQGYKLHTTIEWDRFYVHGE
jgi:FkbM family methyltransferase